MRSVLCFACCFLLCLGLFALPASAVEDSSLPSETVDISDSSGVPVLETVSPAPARSPASASDGDSSLVSGLASYYVDSNLGKIHLYVPVGVAGDCLRLSSGKLVNMTNSSIYLYCPEFSNYSFWANRFQGVQYRESTSYADTYFLSGVSLVSGSRSFDDVFPYVLLLILLFLFVVMLSRPRR